MELQQEDGMDEEEKEKKTMSPSQSKAFLLQKYKVYKWIAQILLNEQNMDVKKTGQSTGESYTFEN